MGNMKIASLCAIALTISLGCSKHNFGLPATGQDIVQSSQTNTKVDVVLMVDNSSSMARHQRKLVEQLPALVAALEAQGMDWRLGVITTDYHGSGGIMVGAENDDEFIDSHGPDAVRRSQDRISVGERGDDVERGLDTVKAALLASGPKLRSDAMLSLIFLSDEPDSSATTPASFIQAMDAVKPRFRSGFRSWTANYIGTVTYSQECTSSLGGWNGVGQDYIDVVAATGGVSESICKSSLASAVSNVRVRMSEILTEFALARIPKVSSIVVTINGQVVPQSTTNGWEYLIDKNVIKFHGNQIPKPTDLVNVTFDPAQPT